MEVGLVGQTCDELLQLIRHRVSCASAPTMLSCLSISPMSNSWPPRALRSHEVHAPAGRLGHTCGQGRALGMLSTPNLCGNEHTSGCRIRRGARRAPPRHLLLHELLHLPI
jgi:hypothetical protein